VVHGGGCGWDKVAEGKKEKRRLSCGGDGGGDPVRLMLVVKKKRKREKRKNKGIVDISPFYITRKIYFAKW